MEIDGMSSIRDIDGKNMIYGSTMIRSYLSPEFKINHFSTLYIGAGGSWMRAVSLNKRSISNIFSGRKRKLYFGTAGYVTAGIKYRF